jgi:uncharacterized protein (DUF433 family)
MERITLEPGKCGGRPCVRGMRIRVVDVLGMLAAGMSDAEILADFPDLEAEDIRACLAYAVEVLDEPFRTFEEWSSETDRIGFADL